MTCSQSVPYIIVDTSTKMPYINDMGSAMCEARTRSRKMAVTHNQPAHRATAAAQDAKPKKPRGQPVKHPEGPAAARMEMRLPEAIKAKIDRNGGPQWVIALVREAKEGAGNGSV